MRHVTEPYQQYQSAQKGWLKLYVSSRPSISFFFFFFFFFQSSAFDKVKSKICEQLAYSIERYLVANT